MSPWRKYRIGIHSEPIRTIPISVSEPMRIIANQCEKRFASRLMKNGQKSIRLNSTNSETSIRMNSNQSETKISTQINPISDLSKPDFQSESIRNNSRLEWFGLKIWFRIDLIHSTCFFGLNRIRSDRFFTIFHQTRYKTFSGLVWNDSHWLGYRYRNESE